MKKPARANAARDTTGIFLTKVILFPVLVISSILVARGLGPHMRGLFSYFMLAQSFLLPLVTLGFGNSIIYLLSNKQYEVSRVYWSSLLAGAVQGLVAAFGLAIAWYFDLLGNAGRQIDPVLGFVIAALIPVQGATLMLSRIFIGNSQYTFGNVFSLFQSGSQAILLMVLVNLFPFELNGAVAAIAISTIGVFVAFVVITVAKYRPQLCIDMPYLKEGHRYGLKSWIGTLSTRANLRFDEFMMGMMQDPKALGVYSIALRLSELLWMFPDSAALVLFNKIASAPDEQTRREITSRVHRCMFLTTIPLVLAAGIGGYFLIPLLLGPAYEGTPFLLTILLPGVVAQVTVKVISKYFGAVGKPEVNSLVTTISALCGMGLYSVLIPLWAGIGAAVTCSLAYFIAFVGMMIAYRGVTSPDKTNLFNVRWVDVRWLQMQFQNVFRRRPASPKPIQAQDPNSPVIAKNQMT